MIRITGSSDNNGRCDVEVFAGGDVWVINDKHFDAPVFGRDSLAEVVIT